MVFVCIDRRMGLEGLNVVLDMILTLTALAGQSAVSCSVRF